MDTRNGWDHHIAFARSNAALYRLLLRPGSDGSAASLARPRDGFERLEQAGALHEGITAAEATLVLSSALRGVALRLSYAPDDPDLQRASELLREAVINALVKTNKRSRRR